LRCLLAAAFCAAFFRTIAPLVRAAFLADWLRELGLRFLDAWLACLDRAFLDAADRGSRLSAASVARDRFFETALDPPLPLARSR